MRDDSAEILFESCVREAIMSSSGLCRDVHPSTVSVQHFLRRPRRRAAHPQGARTYDFAKAVVTRHFRCISFLVKEQQVFNDSRGPKRPPRKKKGRFLLRGPISAKCRSTLQRSTSSQRHLIVDGGVPAAVSSSTCVFVCDSRVGSCRAHSGDSTDKGAVNA